MRSGIAKVRDYYYIQNTITYRILLIHTEYYYNSIFSTSVLRKGLYMQKDRGYIHTEQTRLIKSLLYGIYRHLYLKQTRNARFEMHISSVVHIWSKKTINTNVFLLFH
jgi:hypothetical protein